MGKNTQPSTQTTTTQPNQYVAPYLNDYLSQAKKISTQPVSQGVADFSPNQNQAFGMIQNRANAGSPLLNQANQTMLATSRGDYLDPNTNPYLQGTIDQAMGDVRGQMGSTFSGQNFGSSAHEQMMNRGLTEAISPILMQNYQNERALQQNASMAAPQFAQADYQDANALLGVGNQQQALAQQKLSYPEQQLGLMGSAINTAGGQGGSVTSPNPNKSNTGAGLLGGAAAGAGIYDLMGAGPLAFSNPWALGAMGAGALLGGGLLG